MTGGTRSRPTPRPSRRRSCSPIPLSRQLVHLSFCGDKRVEAQLLSCCSRRRVDRTVHGQEHESLPSNCRGFFIGNSGKDDSGTSSAARDRHISSLRGSLRRADLVAPLSDDARQLENLEEDVTCSPMFSHREIESAAD